MLRTAGSYSIGSRRSSLKCTKVEISLKVCDSAGDDRSPAAFPLCPFPSDTVPVKLLLGASILEQPVSQFYLSFLGEQAYCVLLRGHYYWMSHHP